MGTVVAGTAHAAQVSPNDKIRLAFMGVRSRGVGLARAFCSFPDVEVGYICDPDLNVVDRCVKVVEEKKGKGFKVVQDIRIVLDDPSVDAVIMATPIHWHAAGTILACDAGKDVYVEKPASHNIREGQLMIEAARRNSRIVQLGIQSRSRPVTKRFIEYTRSGKIGDILMAKAGNVQGRRNIGFKRDQAIPEGVDYDLWLGPVPEVSFNPNHYHGTVNWSWHFGCGDIGNDGVHWLDVARWVLDLDLPGEISGMGRKLAFEDDQETPDTQNIEFNYENKLITFEQRLWNSYRMEGSENTVYVYGTEGMIQTGRWINGYFAFRHFDNNGNMVYYEQEKDPGEGLMAHAKNFLDCVRSRKRPNADIEVGHKSTVLCHLGNIVTRTGRNFRFEPGTETIIGDAEAAGYISREYRDHWSAAPFRN
jgi:predicted dehydrogenase